MKKRWLILAGAVLIYAGSCNRKDGDKVGAVTPTEDVGEKGTVEDLGPHNPDNPYDSAGYWHNEVLGYLSEYRAKSDTPDHALIAEGVSRFARSRMGINLPADYFSKVPSTIADRDSGFRSVVAGLPYPEVMKESARELITKVGQQTADVSLDYERFKRSVLDYETKVLASNLLDDEMKRVLLEAASVARYSAYYWIRIKDPGGELKGNRFMWWLAAITSDIAGTVVGGVLHGADCSEYAYSLLVYSYPSK